MIKVVNEIKTGAPAGWLVRVLKDSEGKMKSCEYGVHVKSDVFVSVTLHVSVLPKLMKMGSYDDGKEEYYGVPVNIPLKLIKTKLQSGKVIPMLVLAKEGQEPDKLTCIAYKVKGVGESIVDVRISSGTIVRDYLPKDRTVMALMIVSKPEDIIANPIEIDTAVLGSKMLRHVKYYVNEYRLGEDDTSLEEVDEPIRTKFVTFESRFMPNNTKPRLATKTYEKPQAEKKEWGKAGQGNKKPFNNNRSNDSQRKPRTNNNNDFKRNSKLERNKNRG